MLSVGLPPSHPSSRSLSCWRRRTNGICLSVLTGDGRTDGAEAASLPPPLHGIYNAAGAHRDRTRYAPSALASAPSPPAPPRSPPGWAAASSSAAAAVLLNPEPVITGLRIDHLSLSLSLSLSYSAPLLCMRQRLDVGLPVDGGVEARRGCTDTLRLVGMEWNGQWRCDFNPRFPPPSDGLTLMSFTCVQRIEVGRRDRGQNYFSHSLLSKTSHCVRLQGEADFCTCFSDIALKLT